MLNQVAGYCPPDNPKCDETEPPCDGITTICPTPTESIPPLPETGSGFFITGSMLFAVLVISGLLLLWATRRASRGK